MRVLHLMLSNFYIDGANYQENVIPRINKSDGHDVLIVASTDIFVSNNKLGTTNPSRYFNDDGIEVIRLKYKCDINRFLSMKIRSYKGLWKILQNFKPDLILFHGTAAYELNTVGRYKKKFPHVKLLVDSHEDFNNSARGFLSKNILHRLFYKQILLRNLKYIDKVLYITKETYNFQHNFYKVPNNKLEFFPLGGEIPSVEHRLNIRNKVRQNLGLNEHDILCIHSGKIDTLKRTDEILNAFKFVERSDLKLIIIGSVDEKFENTLNSFLKDTRIDFLGWRTPLELQEYLMAGDLYLQLGSQSATMQQALCNGCIVAVYPFESHTYLLKDACFYIRNESELSQLLSSIDIATLNKKRNASSSIINEVLDYRVISNYIFTI